MPNPKSKFFRVLTEGDTTDGRVVERAHIEQMAATFDRAKYGARVWMEHYRSALPDSPFRAYGDVLAVKTEEVTLGDQKKLALLAQIDPTGDLVAMNKARQKIYTSCEVDPNFAKSGQAYLVGLAVTDSPASLGTELLAFAAGAKLNPLTARKQSPDNLFTEAHEVTLEWEDAPGETAGASLFTKVKELLTGKGKQDAGQFADHVQAIEAIALSQRDALDQVAQLNATLKGLEGKFSAMADKAAAAWQEFTALKAALDKAPEDKKRPEASGGTGASATDC